MAVETVTPLPTATAVPPTNTPAPTATAIALPTATAVPEQAVQIIPLTGPLAAASAEISGLAWYGDMLILLPQFPQRFDEQLFALSKTEIVAFLDGTLDGPLTPQPIPLLAPDLAQIPGYEGLEAIAFAGDQVFVTIESSGGQPMMGYVVNGRIAPDLSQIELNTANLVEIAPPVPLPNYSDEAMLVANGVVVTIYEANGYNINPAAAAHQFSTDLEPLESLSFPAVEYRVTDATAVDGNGRFWVINYLYPGDIAKLDIAPDTIAERYGTGPSHAASQTVERLIELQIGADSITLTESPPIQLQLLPNDEARNWEGIVRLDDAGFILATDKFPETILGFVARP